MHTCTLQSMLCQDDHDTVIAQRLQGRANKRAREKQREDRRYALENFLITPDSLLPELLAVDERDEFAKEVSKCMCGCVDVSMCVQSS